MQKGQLSRVVAIRSLPGRSRFRTVVQVGGRPGRGTHRGRRAYVRGTAAGLLAVAALPFFALGFIAGPAAAQADGEIEQPSGHEPVPESVTEHVTRSVGLVRSAGVIGSGWVAGEDTVVTNLHVARAGTTDIYIDFSDGERVECYTVVADRDMDLAVLKCPSGDRPVVPVAPPGITAGSAVATIGYPGGVGPTVTRGELLPHRDVVRGITTLAYTAATQPGSSGSPVVDAAGRAVGVVTFSGGRGVPIAELVPLLERADGLPATKQGAENRLRLRRSLMALVVVFPVALFVRYRWSRDPVLLGAVRWAIGGAVVALALTQVQFMAAGPTLFL